MDFNSRNYQTVKFQIFFKTNNFFFLFHSAKLNFNLWIETEQNFKKLKLKYSKVLNSSNVLKLFNTSIYQNLSPVVCGFVLFLNLSFKTTKLNLKFLKKDFKPLFELISIKLNNKMYSISQLKGLNILSYQNNIFILYKSFNRHLITSYLLTKTKINSK